MNLALKNASLATLESHTLQLNAPYSTDIDYWCFIRDQPFPAILLELHNKSIQMRPALEKIL